VRGRGGEGYRFLAEDGSELRRDQVRRAVGDGEEWIGQAATLGIRVPR
jgi:hypothetical protein